MIYSRKNTYLLYYEVNFAGVEPKKLNILKNNYLKCNIINIKYRKPPNQQIWRFNFTCSEDGS
jgi:hypothetical protein